MENGFSKFFSNVKLIVNGFSKMKTTWDNASPRLLQLLSPETWENFKERVENLSDVWASYGWVPLLPDSKLDEMIGIPDAPASQSEIDSFMQMRISGFGEGKLFELLRTSASRQELNNATLNDAIVSFENGLFTACALCLFALIDERYLEGQPLAVKNHRRALAKKATAVTFQNSIIAQYFFFANTTNKIIEKLFSDANDFKNETGLNRNFLSHGMNSHAPDKIDCLKLFILLYSVYSLFQSKLYNWGGKVENP